MEKKGQVTVFIILGVLILGVAILLLVNRGLTTTSILRTDQGRVGDLNSEAESLRSYVDSCIEEAGEKSLVTLGYRGGKEELVRPYFNGELFDSNYLYYLGEGEEIALPEMEESLGLMMDQHLPECLPPQLVREEAELNQEIVNYGALFHGLEVGVGEVNTTVVISEEAVLFTVKWPLALRAEGQEKILEDFSTAQYPVRLKKMVNFVNGFLQKLEVNPYFLNTAYLLNQNLSYDLTVAEGDTYLVLVTDDQSLIDSRPFQFLFAGKVPTEGVLI